VCDVHDSLNTPHLHRLGPLAPGKHRLTIRVNNALIHPIGDKGHCYTEETQTKWNGVVGRIELRAHPLVWIEQQRVFPSNDGAVRIEVTVGNEAFHPVEGTLSARVVDKTNGKVLGTGRAAFSIARGLREDGSHILYRSYPTEVTLKLSEPPRLWSEFNPELYEAEIQVQATVGGKSQTDSATATFGFRSVGRTGHHVAINDRPTFIRGNLDCVHFPLTGYPPCDVESWRRIFRIYKDHGLNQVRFPSWSPPDAAFQAADELGIYIQAEVLWIDLWMGSPQSSAHMNAAGYPQGVGKNDRTIDRYARAEITRILDAYGNHPSFVFLVIGNELGSSNFEVMDQWIHEEKLRDPRRLYSASSARRIMPSDDFSDTHVVPDAGPVVNRLGVPHTDWDYEKAYSRGPVPIIAHEMGQMAVHPCWDEIAKYTGVLRARNLEAFRELARKGGVESQSREFQKASGAISRIIYKSEMEAQLRSPSCGGVSWLGMQDYSGQGEALIGWLDSFYDSKGIVTPSQFRRYGGSTVPLARFKKYVWCNDEKFQATAQIAHCGPQPLKGAVAVWRLNDAQGKTIAQGEFAPVDLPVGSVTTFGFIEIDLRAVRQAARVNLEVAIGGTEYANDWNLWVFPSAVEQSDSTKASATPAEKVVVCDRLEAAMQGLSQGRRVLLLAHQLGDKTNARRAVWKTVNWSTTWVAEQNPTNETMGALVQNRHPALAEFPTEAYLDWQWHDLCNGAHGFVLDGLPADYRPIVQPISDFHIGQKIGGIFELRTKEGGKLLVCGYNIADKLADRPVARQLRRSLLDYVAGPAFDPKQETTAEQLSKLLR